MKMTELDQSRLIDMVNLWNKEMSQQFPMREELFKQNSFDDENVFEAGSAIALNEKNDVIGFVISKRWQEDIDVEMNGKAGWIQVLLVDSDYRKQGIGSALLEKAEKALMADGAEKLILGGDPWHYFPSLPVEFVETGKWFQKRSYNKGVEIFDLIAHFKDQTESALPYKANVEFSLLKVEEEKAFLQFMHETFPGRWEYEAMKYFEKGGTGREFVVLKIENKIKGFCRINDSQSPFIAQNVYWAPLFQDLGGLGPLGVDENVRGKGYGLAIVEAGVHFLRSRGIQSIIIDWTIFVDFYGKLGFKPHQSYFAYSKEVENIDDNKES